MLNIKRPETYGLTKAVAQRTGVSLTEAVTEALKEKLSRLDEARAEDRDRRIAAMQRIAQEFRDAWGEPLPTREELDAAMYDEHGLPK